MAKGISIHVGLNAVDPKQYGGWDGKLAGCENDARDMKAIADARGFKSQILLTADATSTALLEAISKASHKLTSGDILFLTYSGHGGQVDDTNGDEPDGKDETWVLYDRQVIDDELYAQYANFAAGVRIAVLSDSCHSGSVLREMVDALATVEAKYEVRSAIPQNYKYMPKDVEFKDQLARKDLYAALQKKAGAAETLKVKASVLLISGCQDNQFSADGARNGLFTEKLLKVWNNGSFKGTYTRFFDEIKAKMPQSQTPNFYKVGKVDRNFYLQTPFTIVSAHAAKRA